MHDVPSFFSGQSAAIALTAAVLALLLGVGAMVWAFYKVRRLAFCRNQLQRVSNSLYLAEKMGGIGSWILNVRNQTIQWSDQVFVIHKRDPSCGEPGLEDGIGYYHPADRAKVQAMIERAIEHGLSFEFKARLIAEDGSIKPVISRGICQIDDAGKLERVYGVFIAQPHAVDIDRFDNDNVAIAA